MVRLVFVGFSSILYCFVILSQVFESKFIGFTFANLVRSTLKRLSHKNEHLLPNYHSSDIFFGILNQLFCLNFKNRKHIETSFVKKRVDFSLGLIIK